MEQEEPRRLELKLPDADVFLENLEKRLEEIDEKCIEIISERLCITKEEAKELGDKLQDEAFDEYMKEQELKGFRIRW